MSNPLRLARRAGASVLQWACSLGLGYALWRFVLAPHLSPVFFTGPNQVFSQLRSFAETGALWSMVRVTLSEALLGFALGATIGVLLAVAIGVLPSLFAKVVEPVVSGVYAMPKFVLAPILFVWVGTGLLPRAYLVLAAVLPVVTIYTVGGIRTVDTDQVKMLLLLGANRRQVARTLIVPHMFRYLMTSIAVVIPHALTVAVGAEILFGADNGIGGTLYTAGEFFRPAAVLGALLVGTIISAVLMAASRAVESHFLGRMAGSARG
ncbi:MAG TPA: ABC transporter permease subunit [Acidimicrobiales bacterium]|nr:ABC transporter permease subunit [Acidimicrobiales bacterium]